jgi:hypothetical protein
MTLEEMMMKEVYLGDGLYASYDGWQIKLRAPDERGGDREVFLEPDVIARFEKYLAELRAEIAVFKKQEGLSARGI